MKIVIGGAQLADSYGISNQKKFIPKKELEKIFDLSVKKKNNYIDTASNYKKSLETISKFNKDYKLKIILKIDIGNNKTNANNFQNKINDCFKRLNKKSIYCLMIHDTKNLLKLNTNKKKEIFKLLEDLKTNNKIKKIGYSIYDLNELKYLKKIKKIDLVQLPINIFDQNLVIGNKLAFLKKRKIEIHARSIFLQGLIFLDLANTEKVLGNKSSKIIKFYNEFSSIEKRLFHCINFIKNCKLIDKAVVGVTSFLEFRTLIDNFERKKIKTNYKSFMIRDRRIIRPFLWKKKY